jgi:GT2 family glycosyltransferase
MPRLLQKVLSPFKLFLLASPSRLQRFWYYFRAGQYSILADRLKRLLDLETTPPFDLVLYSSTDRPGLLSFPLCEHPLVSILVPAYNHWDTTRACLLSLLENTHDFTYEVIVADDGSTDETRNLSHHTTNVRGMINNVNLGFLKNCNHAAQQARGKYLVLLNNDTNVQPGWLKPLVESVEHDEKIGLVGPMLLYPNGRLQEAGGIIWKDGSGWNYGHLDYPERAEYNYLKEVDYISGACILVRKALWDDIGGFDERFAPAYYEDTDLAFEIRRRGYKVVYQPLSKVVHFEGITHGKDVSTGIKSYQERNRIKFRAKWASTLDIAHGCDVLDIFTARDRSANKKSLLFIDHYVPFYDKDAGSKSTFQYLRLMAEMGYHIVFIGDNYVAHQPYTVALQQMGIEVLHGSWYQRHWKKWLATNGRYFDYAYLSRPHIARKYLPYIKYHTSAKLLYCGHDLHGLREARRYQLEGNIAYYRTAQKWERIENDILCAIDVGYYFSDFEVDELHKRLPNVTVRTIPLYLFDDAEFEDAHEAPVFSERQGLLFVGGFMHAPNVDAVCWFAKEIMPLILEHLPDVVLTVVGANPPAEVVRLAGEKIVVAGQISDEALREQYRRCRLVVAPLRFGAGVKGKIVEAMRYGVPTVTTPIGAEGIGDAPKALLIAEDAQIFAEMVVSAYSDMASWEAAAKQVRKAAQDHFSKNAARAILSQDMPL